MSSEKMEPDQPNPKPQRDDSKPEIPQLSLGRKAWSQNANMAVGLANNSKAADEEERAEVEVLKSRLEKTRQLNRKIQGSLLRLESNGKTMEDAIGPIYKTTQRLQIIGNNVDGVLASIDKIRRPSDIRVNEDTIIRQGPDKAGLPAFLSSIKRLTVAVSDMQRTNLRSNQQAQADLSSTLAQGIKQLEGHFAKVLEQDSRPVDPLSYIMKGDPLPPLSPDRTNRLGLIASQIATSSRQAGRESPLLQVYARVRGPYLTASLQNSSTATLSTARKRDDGSSAIYRKNTNAIGSYAQAMEAFFEAEYDIICSLFARDEWAKVFNLTCQGAVSELARTLRDLNGHIKANLNTDCFLAYEIIEVMSNLSAALERKTGELKTSFANALRPIKETGKASLADLLDDSRRKISNLQALPPTADALPITTETMTRLQTMVEFLPPISSIMISIGDGGWKTNTASSATEQIPSLASFDVTADGKQIFANYCIDTINALLSTIEMKGKQLYPKNNQTLGAFLMNNATIVNGMIRGSDLQPLLSSRTNEIDTWRKKAASIYSNAWKEPSMHLMDVQYTSRGRPASGSAANINSTDIVKGLSSKDKEGIKDKFRLFNSTFEECLKNHMALHMEREVRAALSSAVRQMIEQLYCRFWDKYHEIDKGKGKYVKWNKAQMSGVFLSMG